MTLEECRQLLKEKLDAAGQTAATVQECDDGLVIIHPAREDYVFHMTSESSRDPFYIDLACDMYLGHIEKRAN